MKRSYIKRTPFKIKPTYKRLKPIGKVGKKTMQATKQWRNENKPNHQGFYECYLCGRWITADEMQVEHTKSRARHPDLRTEKTLFKQSCYSCNESKGSNDS